MGTSCRPSAIQWWTKSRRTMTSFPDIDISVFPSQVRDWWNTIQPAWRRNEGSSRILSRDAPLNEDWIISRRVGSNGLLLFVMAAFWWGMAATKTGDISAREALNSFLGDLVYVLESLRNVARSDDTCIASAPLFSQQSSRAMSDAEGNSSDVGQSARTTRGRKQAQSSRDSELAKGRKSRKEPGPVPATNGRVLREPGTRGRVTRSRTKIWRD